MLDRLPTILSLLIAFPITLAFLFRPEPWSVLAILARRLVRVGNKWFNVNFGDGQRPAGRSPRNAIGTGGDRAVSRIGTEDWD